MHSFLLVDKASVSDARQLVRTQLNDLGVDPSLSFECLLAMTEACTNALIHGTKEETPPAQLFWDVDNHHITFVIRDFSSESWDPPAPGGMHVHDLDNLQPGGLGIEIMRDLMDDVRIDSSDDGTEVSMTRQLSGVPADA